MVVFPFWATGFIISSVSVADFASSEFFVSLITR